MASKCFTCDVFHFHGPLFGKGVFKIRENLKFIYLTSKSTIVKWKVIRMCALNILFFLCWDSRECVIVGKSIRK